MWEGIFFQIYNPYKSNVPAIDTVDDVAFTLQPISKTILSVTNELFELNNTSCVSPDPSEPSTMTIFLYASDVPDIIVIGRNICIAFVCDPLLRNCVVQIFSDLNGSPIFASVIEIETFGYAVYARDALIVIGKLTKNAHIDDASIAPIVYSLFDWFELNVADTGIWLISLVCMLPVNPVISSFACLCPSTDSAFPRMNPLVFPIINFDRNLGQITIYYVMYVTFIVVLLYTDTVFVRLLP